MFYKTVLVNFVNITGGKFRNRRVKILDQKNIRPTSSRVREAIFSMIGQDLQGRSFLDSFGGSGIMAVEAYSRGAGPVCITEKNRSAVRQIRNQIDSFDADIQVCHYDAMLGLNEAWDIVFLDPPYSMSVIPFLQLALMNASHMVIVEMPSNEVLDLNVVDEIIKSRGWVLWKHKVYGTTTIRIWHRSVLDEGSVSSQLS